MPVFKIKLPQFPKPEAKLNYTGHFIMFSVITNIYNTRRTSIVVKKIFFSFPVTVNNSIKVGTLVFLLTMFVITENIMKRPV
jgi:hypothetical protein